MGSASDASFLRYDVFDKAEPSLRGRRSVGWHMPPFRQVKFKAYQRIDFLLIVSVSLGLIWTFHCEI